MPIIQSNNGIKNENQKSNTQAPKMNHHISLFFVHMIYECVHVRLYSIATPTENMRGKVLYGVIQAPGITLMFSDKPSSSTLFGNNIQLSLACEDETSAMRVFSALAVGGYVTNPMLRHGWGSTYGEVIDRFKVHWSVYSDAESTPSPSSSPSSSPAAK